MNIIDSVRLERVIGGKAATANAGSPVVNNLVVGGGPPGPQVVAPNVAYDRNKCFDQVKANFPLGGFFTNAKEIGDEQSRRCP